MFRFNLLIRVDNFQSSVESETLRLIHDFALGQARHGAAPKLDALSQSCFPHVVM